MSHSINLDRRGLLTAFTRIGTIAFVLLLCCTLNVRADPPDEPINVRDWCKSYANALTIRYATKGGDSPFQLYHDGPDSPYIKYLDEMKPASVTSAFALLSFPGTRPASLTSRPEPTNPLIISMILLTRHASRL